MPEKCNICNREFNSEQGLNNHRRDKHGITIKNEYGSERDWTRLFIYVGVFLLVAFLIFKFWPGSGKGIGSLVGLDCKTAPAEELFINSHTGAKSHDHANLEIVIDGKKEFIPANVGVEAGKMRPVHTHDGGGKLHIEGPCIRDFVLGDFFKIWGKEFNSQCIFENCANEGGLKVIVNGKENSDFENLVLRDGQKIRVEYVRHR